MFGTLKQFIEVQFPPIGSYVLTEQNQQQKQSTVNQYQRKKIYSAHQQYHPEDKSSLLARFNLKNCSKKKNASVLSDKRKQVSVSLSQKRPLYANTSFFGKNQITKDYIAKSELKRKHNLLRAIVRTNQNENINQGISDYDQSFKRLYEKFQSIYAKPILEYRNFVIDESDQSLSSHISVQIPNKPINSLNNRKRIEYENCLSWAKKHKKKSQFYQRQLGKHLKQKKQEKINIGHSMMPQVERKIRTLSHRSRFQ